MNDKTKTLLKDIPNKSEIKEATPANSWSVQKFTQANNQGLLLVNNQTKFPVVLKNIQQLSGTDIVLNFFETLYWMLPQIDIPEDKLNKFRTEFDNTTVSFVDEFDEEMDAVINDYLRMIELEGLDEEDIQVDLGLMLATTKQIKTKASSVNPATLMLEYFEDEYRLVRQGTKKTLETKWKQITQFDEVSDLKQAERLQEVQEYNQAIIEGVKAFLIQDNEYNQEEIDIMLGFIDDYLNEYLAKYMKKTVAYDLGSPLPFINSWYPRKIGFEDQKDVMLIGEALGALAMYFNSVGFFNEQDMKYFLHSVQNGKGLYLSRQEYMHKDSLISVLENDPMFKEFVRNLKTNPKEFERVLAQLAPEEQALMKEIFDKQ
ncbi:hypothetical protein FC40_GL001233 [Ligilactobacillus hayakitensis DSM 18933 = JCM 14209]|uniref:DUF6933 domain-containing protein n=1 Tax=Ligilactobacillus hayakitensis DSM 18933 = JCM 14209 TaxID=1423755 RepID=A0A0R1WQE7_9LACO|nr:hypothetical protein FC40_GL001233 [Ligilactobacillus hayakitensis DSM 18933 = JCM 14209]